MLVVVPLSAATDCCSVKQAWQSYRFGQHRPSLLEQRELPRGMQSAHAPQA
jgi:hypothetical protein